MLSKNELLLAADQEVAEDEVTAVQEALLRGRREATVPGCRLDQAGGSRCRGMEGLEMPSGIMQVSFVCQYCS